MQPWLRVVPLGPRWALQCSCPPKGTAYAEQHMARGSRDGLLLNLASGAALRRGQGRAGEERSLTPWLGDHRGSCTSCLAPVYSLCIFPSVLDSGSGPSSKTSPYATLPLLPRPLSAPSCLSHLTV